MVSLTAMSLSSLICEPILQSIVNNFELQHQKCPTNMFYNSRQKECEPQFGCNAMNDVLIYDDVILDYSSARVIKLAKWVLNRHKKLVKHHSLNMWSMEPVFKQHLSLYKSVLNDQLLGHCDAPGHLAFVTEFHKPEKSVHPQSIYQRLLLCSSYTELLKSVDSLSQGELSLIFDDEEDFFENVKIVQDPNWRIILDDIQLIKPTNHSQFAKAGGVYMAPEICNAFLKCKFCKEAKVLLTEIHKQCRDKHPENRPTVMQLHHKYSQVAQKMQLMTELR